MPLDSNEQIEDWISVENIVSVRKCQTGNTRKKKQELRELRKKLMIPLTACDRFLERDFPHTSLTLMHNPPGDGNCQFGYDSIGMVNHFDDLTCHMDGLQNEILTIIIDQVLISSNFSWRNHRCHIYNQLCNINTHFQDIT